MEPGNSREPSPMPWGFPTQEMNKIMIEMLDLKKRLGIFSCFSGGPWEMVIITIPGAFGDDVMLAFLLGCIRNLGDL